MRSAKPSTTAVLPTPGLAGEDRIVLPAARQDVDDLADLEVAAEDRDRSCRPCACAVRSMVNWSSAPEPPGRHSARAGAGRFRAGRLRRSPARVFAAVGGDRGEVALQRVGRDVAAAGPTLARAPRQRLVGQQRPEQMPRAHARRALLERGQQPGLLDHLDDVGRQRGARALPVFIRSSARVEVGQQARPGRSRSGAGSRRGRYRTYRAGRSADARSRHCSGCGQRSRRPRPRARGGRLVQASDQRFQLYWAHVFFIPLGRHSRRTGGALNPRNYRATSARSTREFGLSRDVVRTLDSSDRCHSRQVSGVYVRFPTREPMRSGDPQS